jgi:hypothetical protein
MKTVYPSGLEAWMAEARGKVVARATARHFVTEPDDATWLLVEMGP